MSRDKFTVRAKRKDVGIYMQVQESLAIWGMKLVLRSNAIIINTANNFVNKKHLIRIYLIPRISNCLSRRARPNRRPIIILFILLPLFCATLSMCALSTDNKYRNIKP